MTAPFVMKDWYDQIITEPKFTHIIKVTLPSLHMTIDKFRRLVQRGLLNDGDGHGKLATFDSKSNVMIMPSDMEDGNKFPEWATHMIWFNK